MITIRYSAFMLAAICLGALSQTPNSSPATIRLAGLFFIFLVVVAWTCRETNTRRRP